MSTPPPNEPQQPPRPPSGHGRPSGQQQPQQPPYGPPPPYAPPAQPYAPQQPSQGPSYPQQQPAAPFGQQPAPGPIAAPGATAQVNAMRPWFKKKRFVIPLGFLALILLVNIGNGGNNPAPVAGTSTSSTRIATPTGQATDGTTGEATDQPTDDPTEEVTDEPADDPTEEPTEEPTKEPEPKISSKQKAFNNLSDEQQEAVGEGQDYLESQAFSKDGLIDQLSSEYGAQYKKKDAKKAVEFLEDHGGVDWKEEAVLAAKEYRSSQHFSTQGLIDQLDSDYGGQFTHDQAVYGVKHSR